ncbi:MAG: hypothetical protein ACE37F_11425 [Nannocystaceae bacterium]|nr:hypothetical protein [bacterium]
MDTHAQHGHDDLDELRHELDQADWVRGDALSTHVSEQARPPRALRRLWTLARTRMVQARRARRPLHHG